MADPDTVEIKDAKDFFAKNKATTTLFVGNLPQTISQNKLEKLFSDVGPIRRSFIVRNKGVGYVTFAMREDADRAIKNGITHDGRRLNLKFAKKRSEQSNLTSNEADVKTRKNEEKEKRKMERPKHVNPKKGKLIVRNISFKADENAVRNEFSKFGNITEIIIPKKPDGKMRGFCFVQFKNTLSAHKAVQAMNGKDWMGRPIAIDVSLPKLKYLDLKQTEKNNAGTDSEVESEDDDDATIAAPSTKSSINEIEDDTKIEMKKKKNAKVNSSGDRCFSRDDEVHDFKDSESDEDDELESDGGDGDDNGGKEENENDDEEENEDDDENEEEEDDYDEEEEEQEKMKVSHKKQEPKASDVGEGKTLFIRNLSFETTKEQLKEAFVLYGELHYAIVCIDPSTEYSKGSGFVKFRNKEDAEACLAKSEEKDGILLDGHKLTLSVAMSKEELKQKAEDKAKKPKDNRNLYLAREGLIRPGTEAAKDVSKADLEKRVKLEVWKHGMLRNLNVFVSRYRLCVRNIPLTVGDKRLRKTFEDAAGDGAEVTEARIMRDIRQVSANGEAPSKGYGFVRFTSHDHALKALRHTNNNPDIFTKNTRPIVEFSLENREALNAKQKRQEKSVENNKMNREVQQKSKGKSGNIAKHLTDDGTKQLPFFGTKSNPAEKKGLPSHVGPKIRHNGRRKTPKISRQKLRRDKIKMMKNKRQQNWEKTAPSISTVKPPKKKRPVDRDEAHLQKLVSSHKRKRRGDNKSAAATPKKSAKRGKWFA